MTHKSEQMLYIRRTSIAVLLLRLLRLESLLRAAKLKPVHFDLCTVALKEVQQLKLTVNSLLQSITNLTQPSVSGPCSPPTTDGSRLSGACDTTSPTSKSSSQDILQANSKCSTTQSKRLLQLRSSLLR